MSNKILLIGGGGHCKSVLDSLIKTGQYSEIGIIDRKENVGKRIFNVPIIGTDEDLPRFFLNGFKEAFITIGSVGNPKSRTSLYQILEEIGFEIPNVVDLSAVLSDFIQIEKGVFIGKNAVINAGSFIHKGAIINTSAIIEHDCVIGEFSHIAPGSVICGEVKVGNHTHIGASSVVKQQLAIGANTIIGMGSTVISNISDSKVAYGNPCKEVREN